MFKVKLLISALIISNANLFAVKDLISFLPAERQRQVADESGYNLPNARLAAVRFLLIKSPGVANTIKLTLMESIGQLFADGRPVIKESDIYSKIAQIVRHNGIMIDLLEIDSSRLDCEDSAERVAGTKRKREPEPEDTSSAIMFSLKQFMSADETSRVADQKGYYPGQLNDALRRFLEKNGASFSDEKIQAIKKEFNDKYFKGTTSGRHIAPMGPVDADFNRLIDEHKLDACSIAIPKIEFCGVYMHEIEECSEVERCLNTYVEHVFHRECIAPALETKPNECPMCQAKLHLDSEDLFKSAKDGDRLALARCIAAGVNANSVASFGCTALMVAAYVGQKEVVEILLEAGANVNAVNQYGNTALILAAKYNHIKVVEMLLRAGANVNAVGSEGDTALIMAAKNGYKEVVKMLLEIGANVNAVGSYGDTTLMLASENGHIEIVEILLKAGIHINAVNLYGDTALIWASENGHIEIIEMLLRAGAHVNAVGSYGDTALIRAAENGHTDAIEALLKAGANVNTTNKFGNTALMFAEDKGHTEVVELLRANGAKE